MKPARKASRPLKRARAAAWFALPAIILSFSLANPAFSAASAPQKMTYQVYAGGINAVNVTLEIAMKGEDRYFMKAWAKTQGFLNSLVPWHGTFESDGWNLGDGKFLPEMHVSISNWKGEDDRKEYSYGKDGVFRGLKVIEAGQDKSPAQIDHALTDNSTDFMAATLEALENVAKNGDCTGTSEIFDGSRRFRMIYGNGADEELSSSEYNLYAGPAKRCTVEVQPAGGKWHDKPRGWFSIQEQGRDKGTMPTIWMASITPGAPAVPVKVMVKTDYGTLFLHLVGYESGEKTMYSENMPSAEEMAGGK